MMRRDESIFVLWHTSVLGLVAVAVQMGWAAPLCNSTSPFGRATSKGISSGGGRFSSNARPNARQCS